MSDPAPGRADGSVRLVHPAILVTSAVGIAYQIALMRVFSVSQWYHFAYMIISVAMLGFAVSGTALALLRTRIRGHEPFLFRLGAVTLPLALSGCYVASQQVPFETFELVSRPGQFWNLLSLYTLLAVPFFTVSWCITLGFLMQPRRVGRVYFVNMVGSGLGAAVSVGCLFLLDPGTLAFGLGLPAALVLPLSVWGVPPRRAAAWLAALAGTAGLALATGPPSIRISPYKGLSYALQLPDATIEAWSTSPLSVLTAVSSSHIRETPGQISNYPMDVLGRLPEQIALYFDGGSASPINRFHGDPGEMAFLSYVTAALPYQLVDRPDVVVVGAGGGTEVLNALHHGALHVTAVDVDRRVMDLVRGKFGGFSGGLYERPDVSPVISDGRRYLETSSEESHDLIQIALFDSFNATAAGVHSLSESYLYTVEAITAYISRLSPSGLLSVTRWITTPPRDAIKMFATFVEAAERAGIDEPAEHLLMIRSWNTATLVLSRSPLTSGQVESAKRFAESRWFDIGYYPGMERREANRFIILDEPVYFLAAMAILSEDRARFYRRYPFYVRPATDDRPHFSRFFRWTSLPAIRATGPTGRGGLVEWGYVTLVATLVQAVVLAAGLVLVPLLLFAGRVEKRIESTPAARRPGRFPILAYFGALGLAYMFLEIAFIQRLMLFLAHPIYAVAVVLTGFLVFSGLGSYFADRQRPSHGLVVGAVASILLLVVLYHLSLTSVFRVGLGWPEAWRVTISLGLLAPLAFAMGIPFPVGLQTVSDLGGGLVPWAWGWNGAMSVVGAALAAWIAVHLGFAVVTALAVALYLVAAVVLRELVRHLRPQPSGGP